MAKRDARPTYDLTLFGLNHGIIGPAQCSLLVAAVIVSAGIPTAIANARFMPRRLLPGKELEPGDSLNGELAGNLDT